MTKVLTGPPGPHPDDDGDWDDDDEIREPLFHCLGGIAYPLIHREPVEMVFVGDIRLCPICDVINHRTCKCHLPKAYIDPEKEPPLLD